MSQIVSFEDYTPPVRFDGTPWTTARVEESVSQNGPWTLNSNIALNPLDADPARPAPRSFTVQSNLAAGWYRVTFVDALGDLSGSSQPVASPSPASATLITLAEYKDLLGVQAADTRNDAQIAALLPAATVAVKSFTGRDFTVTTGVATPRTFQYEGEWIIDIDDCTAVSAVSTDAGTPGQTYALTADQWTAMPQDGSPIVYYLLIHGGPFWGVSPEMGFERNLDTYEWYGKRPLLTVTAVWGWPSVPDDVKLATALTVKSLVGSGGGGRDESLTAEAIEGYSRAWGARTGISTALTIPNRARDLLAAYQRIMV